MMKLIGRSSGFLLVLFLFAVPGWTQVSITSPKANATVSGTVSFSCTDSAPHSTTGLYIDNSYVSGGTYLWDTTHAANGLHYLLCNGYVNASLNGFAAVNVTVNNSGSTPVPTATATSSPKPTSVPTPGNCASTIDVPCSGRADGAALQDAMSCSGSVVRPHGTCDVDQGLVGTNIGYEGQDATLNIEPIVTVGVTIVTGTDSYTARPWNHLRIVGSSDTGLLLAGNFTHLDQPSISGFKNNITIGTNAYLDTITAPTIWNGGVGINCPTSPNAGEGIIVVGGVIFNLGVGSYNSGCGLTFLGTHFDGISGTPLVLNEGSNGAWTDCTNCYIESNTLPTGGAMLAVTGYNGNGSMQWSGGQIQQDNFNTPTPLLSLTNNGTNSTAPFIRVSNTRFNNVTVGGLSTNPNVALCADMTLAGGGLIGNIPNSGVCP